MYYNLKINYFNWKKKIYLELIQFNLISNKICFIHFFVVIVVVEDLNNKFYCNFPLFF